ncbi:MAG: DctP family TRAP transporter solute-binding subunit [Rhodospirillales bacterium]|nr:DctP family TRAP transporter solute-binding subunit [Rhodospirillales bacterium]
MGFLRKVLALILGLSVLVSAAVAEEPILIRFSHVVGENTPKGVGANLFKRLVEERLAGRVAVEVYPASQKFSDDEVLNALLFGDVEMAAPSLAKFNRWAKALQVFDLPFLFEDVDHIHRFQQSDVGRRLLSSMTSRGIQGLAFWDNGPRVISSTKKLNTPGDADGLVFRIEPSDVFQEQYARIGAVGVAMPFSRLTDAIRDGVVNGQENTWSNIYSRKIHKLHRHFTEIGHSHLGYMVITGADFWRGLPRDIRASLEEILAEVTAEVNGLAAEKNEEARNKAMAEGGEGVVVFAPIDDQLQAWRDAWMPVWSRFEPDIGSDVIDAAVNAARRQ